MLNKIKLFSTLVIFCLSPLCAKATQEEANFLANAAKQYMLAQFQDRNSSNVRYTVKVGRIDPNRDYNGKCSGFLTAELQSNSIKKSNIVKLQCSRKENGYTLYVPVSVNIEHAALIANKNIAKGNVITASDISHEFIENNKKSKNAVDDESLLIGSKSRRDIKQGDQFKINEICTIAKGDNVVIEVSNANLTIKAQGVALTEGKVNDLIQVRNTKSKKIIEARIVRPGLVSVVF